jgi:hypothetical protein
VVLLAPVVYVAAIYEDGFDDAVHAVAGLNSAASVAKLALRLIGAVATGQAPKGPALGTLETKACEEKSLTSGST